MEILVVGIARKDFGSQMYVVSSTLYSPCGIDISVCLPHVAVIIDVVTECCKKQHLHYMIHSSYVIVQ